MIRSCVSRFHFSNLLSPLSILQHNPSLHFNPATDPNRRLFSVKPAFKVMNPISPPRSPIPPNSHVKTNEAISVKPINSKEIVKTNEAISVEPINSKEIEKVDEENVKACNSEDLPSTSTKDKEDSGSDGELSDSDWRPPQAQALAWAHDQMISGSNPRDLLQEIAPDLSNNIPQHMPQGALWNLLVDMLTEPPKRDKLKDYNTVDDTVDLILKCKNIIVLTGAGVSVSCGIPDFRSTNGIYQRLHADFPDLPDPQSMFDIHFFRRNPRPFFDFAKEIYPGQFEPSKFHKFIRLLEERGKLLRNYTQNIDTLEQVASIKNVLQCHGSFASATCCNCKYQVDAAFIREDIMEQKIPICPKCTKDDGALSLEERLRGKFPVLKPDIVFFGENLPQLFHETILQDKLEVDLLIVAGSSLKVRPVALIPDSIPTNVPQIVIDRCQLRHMNFDIELLGNCDELAEELCLRLAAKDAQNAQFWTRFCEKKEIAKMVDLPDWGKIYAESHSLKGVTEKSEMKSIDSNNVEPLDKRVKLDDNIAGSDSIDDSPSLINDNIPSRYINIADKLPDNNSYFFIPPCTYVFSGAEIYRDLENPDDDCSSVDSSDGRGEDILEVELGSDSQASDESVVVVERSTYVKQNPIPDQNETSKEKSPLT